MKIIKKTLVVLVLCSFIMGTVPISVLAHQNSLDNNIFEHKEPDIPEGVEYAPDKIIVKFIEGTSDDTISLINSKNKVVSSEKILKKNPKAVENEKTKILKKHGLDRIYILKLPKNSDVNKMVSKYNENPDVEYAEQNYKVHIDATIPDDEYFSLLWGMHNTGQSEGTADADIDAPDAWDITTGSSDIVVAVIDTGVDYNHPDLNDNMWVNVAELNGVADYDDDGNGYVDDIYGSDFINNEGDPNDDHGHGTHCSGTIAAEGNNGIGVVGVSWNAKIMALKFLGSDGSGDTLGAIDAINYAIDNDADIMSNSWGGGGYSLALKDAILTANDAGILFVAAAGNSRKNTDRRPHYPSSYDVPNIISVAATDHNDALAGFSNYGLNSVDLGAPGVDILSTYPGGYAWGDGTSMAAPHVSGAAALIMAQNPTISVADLKAKILDSVDPIDALAGKTATGGRLNVNNCLQTDVEPELSVAVTAPVIVNVGDSFTVDATISNLGDETATGVEATIALQAGLSTAELLKKSAVDISSGDSAIVSWNVDADPQGTYSITVEASADNAETVSGTTTVEVVTLDTTPPTVTLTAPLDNAYITTESYTVTATASDEESGVASVEFKYSLNEGLYWVSIGTDSISPYEVMWDLGAIADHTVIQVKAIATNNAELAAEDVNSGIVNDGTAPFAAVSINEGAEYTTTTDVILTLTYSDATSGVDVCRYSNDASSWSAWETCTESKAWTLTAGDGTKTVYYEARDNAGNIKQVTDTIALDTSPPEQADNVMHIASIDMSTERIKLTGWYTYATATVTIVDASGTLVEGATVSGHWSGLTSAIDSGTTSTDGTISLDSGLVKNAAGTFTFTVDDVILNVLTYDPGANDETSGSITA